MADEQPNITTRTNPKRGKNGKEREQPAPSESTSSTGEQSAPQSALAGFTTEQAQSITKVINKSIASTITNTIAPLAQEFASLKTIMENFASANSTKTTGANPLISESFGTEQPSQEFTFGGVPSQFGFAPRGFAGPWSRWRPEDLGTFDPDVDDVYSFIDRIRELVHSKKDPHMIQLNLSLQLRNKAKRWFELELTQQDKSTLYAPVNGVSAWIDALVERFQPSGTLLLQKLHETTYTRADAAAKKDPTDFVHNIIALTRTRPLEESLMEAYLRFESGLQVNLVPPTKYTSVAEFMDQINAKKGAWYQNYAHFRKKPQYDTSDLYQQSYISPNAPPNSGPRQNYRQPRGPGPNIRPGLGPTTEKSRPEQAKYTTSTPGAPQIYHGAEYRPAQSHTPRAFGNTHDNDSDEEEVYFAGHDHGCNVIGCPHRHDD